MAQGNLNYVISILKGDLKGLDEILGKLGELRKVAEAGAKFNIELNPASVEAMKRQVTDALGSSIKVDPAGGKGGTVTMDPQLAAKLDALVDRIERVATALSKGHSSPADTRMPDQTANAMASIKAEVSSFRQSMRNTLEESGLGPNVRVVSKREEVSRLRRSERRGTDADSMETVATVGDQVRAVIRKRDKIIGLLRGADDQMSRLASEVGEEQRTSLQNLRNRARSLSERNPSFFDNAETFVTDKQGTTSKKVRRDLTDWAKNVMSVMNEIDRELEQVANAATRPRTTGPGSGAKLSGGGSYSTDGLPFNASMLSASLVGALETAAPRIGRSIGAAVKSVLQNIDFSGVSGGGEGYRLLGRQRRR